MTMIKSIFEQVEMVRQEQEFNYTTCSSEIKEIKFNLTNLQRLNDKNLNDIEDMINESLGE